MQSAQNVFSFIPTAPSSGQISTKGMAQDSGEYQDSGFIASFVALLTQAAEDNKEPVSGTSASLDLTFTAIQGENREEYVTNLPLSSLSDQTSFSKSVLDLMASLKEGLVEKGVDLGAFSESVDDVFTDFDMNRLQAMLSKLQNRYDTVLESDNPRRLEIEVSVSKDLKLGLEALLKQTPAELAEEGERGKSDSEEQVPALGGNVSFLNIPYLYPTLKNELKTETPRSFKTVSKTMPFDVESISDRVSTKTSSDEKKPDPTTPFQDRKEPQTGLPGNTLSQKKDHDGNTKEDAPVKTPTILDASEKTETTSAERKMGFESFFDGILSGRDRSDVQPNALSLAKEVPLSRNEALREGLDQVVRFARTSGEQKATLIIDPPALGRVSVELTSSSTGLEAFIKVSNEQIRQLVQDQIVQLRHSLAQQGVQLTHFSVDVQQDNDQRQQDTQRHPRRSARGVFGGDETNLEDEETTFRVDLTQGLLYWVA